MDRGKEVPCDDEDDNNGKPLSKADKYGGRIQTTGVKEEKKRRKGRYSAKKIREEECGGGYRPLDEEYTSAASDDDNDDNTQKFSNSQSIQNSSSRVSCYYSSSGDNDDDDEEDSDWDEDNLIPYDLNTDNDEEDLRVVAKPQYLQDCLDLLRANGDDVKTIAKHKAGFEALPQLVRTVPPDLPDLSVDLTKQVLNMENKFDLDNFSEYISSGLCALAVCDTDSVIVYLNEGLFGGDFSFGVRLDILDVMRYSSSELCGTVELEQMRHSQQKMEISDERDQIKVMGKRSIVPLLEKTVKEAVVKLDDLNHQVTKNNAVVGNLDTKTRRWGRCRNNNNNRHATTTVTNKFGPLSPFFFYPLIQGFANTKNEEVLWGGCNGGRLLSRLLITLSTIVTNAGTYPGRTTAVLAADLFELAWSFYKAENSEVRMSVLIAIATSIPLLSQEYVVRMMLFDETTEHTNMATSLQRIKLHDSDRECRQLASAILGSLVLESDVVW